DGFGSAMRLKTSTDAATMAFVLSPPIATPNRDLVVRLPMRVSLPGQEDSSGPDFKLLPAPDDSVVVRLGMMDVDGNDLGITDEAPLSSRWPIDIADDGSGGAVYTASPRPVGGHWKLRSGVAAVRLRIEVKPSVVVDLSPPTVRGY